MTRTLLWRADDGWRRLREAPRRSTELAAVDVALELERAAAARGVDGRDGDAHDLGDLLGQGPAVGRVDEWVAERVAAHRAGNVTLVQRLDDGRSLRIVERKMPDGHIVGFRIDITELPFFLSLLDHLAAKGCPVPRTIHDRQGQLYRLLDGKAVALIEFLPGVSVSAPTPEQARAVGRALAQMQLAAADFAGTRENAIGRAEWQRLVQECGASGLAEIDAGFAELVARELPAVIAAWPEDLPRGTIHADLFPDNVLMLGEQVTGLIDFYFACTDLFAYDLAVTHAAWCFSNDGRAFDPAISAALGGGG